jgi:hypothetical protein
MFGIKFVVRLMLICVLLALMSAGYGIINDTDPIQALLTRTKSNSDDFKAPSPDPKALGYCIIESDELFSGSVYDYNKKQMTSKMSPIKCSDCNQYIYKTDNQCSQYMYDREYNSIAPNIDDSSKLSVFCDPAHPERSKNCIQPHGVCSIKLDESKTCNF